MLIRYQITRVPILVELLPMVFSLGTQDILVAYPDYFRCTIYPDYIGCVFRAHFIGCMSRLYILIVHWVHVQMILNTTSTLVAHPDYICQ